MGVERGSQIEIQAKVGRFRDAIGSGEVYEEAEEMARYLKLGETPLANGETYVARARKSLIINLNGFAVGEGGNMTDKRLPKCLKIAQPPSCRDNLLLVDSTPSGPSFPSSPTNQPTPRPSPGCNSVDIINISDMTPKEWPSTSSGP